ncbi:hypothetical protein BB8028_0003g14170 [Beauveria bassiana]|uniref:Uncharacterized protein n=1 Tax=Beauveria bassiana TaxID=176275 RepID=A0A2S7YAD0_BEABA|nr:hypothetical protein BB8028_0003g14170 [Beauveria bassiana]
MSCSPLASCTTLARISTTVSPYPTFGRGPKNATSCRATATSSRLSTSACSPGSASSKHVSRRSAPRLRGPLALEMTLDLGLTMGVVCKCRRAMVPAARTM